MTEDKFFERLREDAQELRYEPADEFAWTRLAARIGERVRAQPTAASFLATWFRPIAASLAALALVAALSVQMIEEPVSVETAVAAGQHSMDLGEALSVE